MTRKSNLFKSEIFWKTGIVFGVVSGINILVYAILYSILLKSDYYLNERLLNIAIIYSIVGTFLGFLIIFLLLHYFHDLNLYYNIQLMK